MGGPVTTQPTGGVVWGGGVGSGWDGKIQAVQCPDRLAQFSIALLPKNTYIGPYTENSLLYCTVQETIPGTATTLVSMKFMQ